MEHNYDLEKRSSGSVEKTPLDHSSSTDDVQVLEAREQYRFDAHDLDRVQRRLHQRHVQMIAIAGTLGTGLFLGSGKALNEAGPAGALIGYALVGTVAYSSLCAVGEMTSLAPISGTFPHFAARWVDPAFGFAVGWNYFYTNLMSVPVEITAATILITFWDANLSHQWIYTLVVVIIVCAINIFGVRWFGEAEFFFSIIKICLILGLILVGLIIDLGGGPDHERVGFRYWRNPGAFAPAGLVSNINTDKFLGFISVIVQAAFSFQGMELVAIAASETRSPRTNIAKAVRRVFYRIVVFYLLGILITGMLVPYDDPLLLSAANNAAQSPYVIAMTRAGIHTLPHIINAAIFTSAFSAGNSFLFCSSRILYGLALRGQAPKFFAKCTQSGLPIVSVLTCSAFALLAFMNVSSGAATVFNWFVSLSTVGGFFGWWGINITYLYFYRGLKAQGRDRKQLIYFSTLQPWLSIWGIFWTTLFILINGFEVFWDFNASGFLTSYINIPLFFGLWIFWKVYRRTKTWKPHQMDFTTGIPTVEETEEPIEPPTTIGGKIAAILF
ncbi:general amino acid permease 1 [Gloeophyllum trabeum ATCC 11539]|uniref:General amino acid permease 1 n=1 Tax=Gloeophyllum trabeum (strain ATCC 11539 / FP-39264 / Madison 617) TaxID=670483 RepID=S7Q835_GLOTA|nr:general amino acid permease 1 [Gloeophyllum trabeum ATCC 11539]EPQ56146.1 general amino acid permease 1 [Gloeophyllum trabeum ATCC 11539]